MNARIAGCLVDNMLGRVFRTRPSYVRAFLQTRKLHTPSLSRIQHYPQKIAPLIAKKRAEYCTDTSIDRLKFNEVCSETLESLCEYFEDVVESNSHFKRADVTYGDGVLTVAFGEPYGTYVINRQSPNKQIWLSSPTSGPKRYDFVADKGGYWVYKHDGVPLHRLLQTEISQIAKTPVDFSNCSHSLV